MWEPLWVAGQQWNHLEDNQIQNLNRVHETCDFFIPKWNKIFFFGGISNKNSINHEERTNKASTRCSRW